MADVKRRSPFKATKLVSSSDYFVIYLWKYRFKKIVSVVELLS